MGPACCITFGTVADSHLFHPRIPKVQATHSITILPFKGEWDRTLACFGNTFKEDVLSHYVYADGVTFLGGWAPPSESPLRYFTCFLFLSTSVPDTLPL